MNRYPGQMWGATSTAGRGRNPSPLPTILATPTIFASELGGTAGATLPREAAKFASLQSKRVRALGTDRRTKMPSWLDELSPRQMTPERIIAEVFRRTLEEPSATHVMEAHALLNEIARDPRASSLIAAQLNGAMIEQLVRPKRTTDAEDEP